MADIRIALVGNPNTGKSTLFNLLTGLNQKIGNFPGITVDKKIGFCKLNSGKTAEIVDLPGTYSLYPKSKDESIVFQVLADRNNSSYPDVVVLVADATNLRRNLLLYSQVADLGLPMLLVLNMTDLAKKEGININVDKLAKRLSVQVVAISARASDGIEKLRAALSNVTLISTQVKSVDVTIFAADAIAAIKSKFNTENDYYALQVLHQHKYLDFFTAKQQAEIEAIEKANNFDTNILQAAETVARYHHLSTVLSDIVVDLGAEKKFVVTDKLDSILTHKIWGFAIFIGILFFVFNAIFSWSSYPMELIETSFAALTDFGHAQLPAGLLTNLLQLIGVEIICLFDGFDFCLLFGRKKI